MVAYSNKAVTRFSNYTFSVLKLIGQPIETGLINAMRVKGQAYIAS